jgi:type II secretory pathway predicted ATPase ExeA
MFEHHFGLRENPFIAGHQARFVYPSPEHQEALAHLRYGIENREPFVLITGEVGTGKTTALYDALAEWQSRVVVALITNSALTRNELLEEIALRFGVAVNGPISKPQLLAQLERMLAGVYQRGDRAIVLLDEAQNLERDLLEEIRLLSNLETNGTKLVQVFLVGQPELEAKLSQPELRQLRQRISVHYRLQPLSPEDTEHYIHHRIGVAGGHALSVFPSDSCREVHRITHGIPREINTVCSQALLNAFVEDARSVRPHHVSSAASEIEFESVLDTSGDEVPEPLRGQVAEEPVRVHPPAPQVEAPPPPVVRQPAPSPEPRIEPAPTYQSEAAEIIEPEPPALRGLESAPPAAREPDPPPAREPEPEPEFVPEPEPEPAPEPEPPEAIEPEAPVEHRGPPLLSQRPVSEPAATAPPDSAEDAGFDLSMIDTWMARLQEAKVQSADKANEPEPPQAAIGAEAPVGREPSSPTRPSPAAEALKHPTTVIPPTPRRPPAPPPQRRSLIEEQRSALPPKLRTQLQAPPDFDEELGIKRSGSKGLLVGVIAIVIVIAAVLLVRFGPWHAKAPGAAASSAPAPTAEPTTSRAAIPKSPENAMTSAATTPSRQAAPTQPAPTPVPAPPRPVPTKTRKAPATTTASTPPAAKSHLTYGIAVATYLDQAKAESEKTKLAASTQLAARVNEVMDGGASVYRIVLGGFDSKSAAENAASDLIKKGQIEEARVVPLGKSAKP